MRKNKLLSILLSLCMVITWMPAGVWADTDTGGSASNPIAQQSGDTDNAQQGTVVDKPSDNGTGSDTGENPGSETNLNKEAFEGLYGDSIKVKSALKSQSLSLTANNGEADNAVANAEWHSNHPICGDINCTEHGNNQTWNAISSKDELFSAEAKGYYYLTNNVTLSSTWEPQDGVVLCLNGKTITMAKNDNVIKVDADVTFTLTDCAETPGKITHGKNGDGTTYTGRGVYVGGQSSSPATFNMYGGSITGNNTTSESGVGVCVGSNGGFNMYGGSITGNNTTGSYGGGVYVASNSKFNMSGTAGITGNTASNGSGGGVYVEKATFTMSGNSSISGNEASSNGHGGGVYVNGGTFEMSGGTIGGNTANTSGYGGGVYVASGTFIMSGSAGITGNTATISGGGVHVSSGGTFEMSGSAGITGNTATEGHGGGVCVNGTFTMTKGSISGNNTTSDNGGGVYVASGSTFNMSGGTIGGAGTADANTAQNGGGVYVNGGTFAMSGSAGISGNNARSSGSSSGGGGVYVFGSDAAFAVSGAVQITGNDKGGTKNNVYLSNGKTITIGTGDTGDTGDTGLTTGASIGVTLDNNYGDKAFTSGWGTHMSNAKPSDYFTSDVQDYVPALDSDSNEVKLVRHTHSWTYTLNEGKTTITATCTVEGCPNANGGSVTISAPSAAEGQELVYDGNPKEATVANTVSGLTTPTITYKKGDTTLDGVPTNAGTYTASITLDEGDAAKTASVEYEIGKATITVTPDGDLSKKYGEQDPTLTYAATGAVSDETPQFTGALSRATGEDVSNNYGIYLSNLELSDNGKFKASNYTLNFDTTKTFTIEKGTQTITVPTDSSIIKNGKEVDISKGVSVAGAGKAATGALTYALAEDYENVTLSDSNMLKVEPAATVTEITINVTAKETNEYNGSTKDLIVKVVDRQPASGITINSDKETVSCGDIVTFEPNLNGITDDNWKWSWSYNSGGNNFEQVEFTINNGVLKVKAVNAGSVTITFSYESDSYKGSVTKTVDIGKKVITKDDLTGIPESLTKVYNGGDKHTQMFTLDVKPGTAIRDNEQLRFDISATDIIYDKVDVGTTTATLHLSKNNLGPNYELAGGFNSITVPATITQATPVVTGTGTATGTYGQKLSEVTNITGLSVKLSNTNDTLVSGTWKLEDEDGATLNDVTSDGNTIEYTAVFTPDSNNFTTATGRVNMTINPHAGGSLGRVDCTQKYTDTAEKTFKPDWKGLPAGETWTYNDSCSATGNAQVDSNSYNAETNTLTYKITNGQAGNTVTFTLEATCNSGHYEPYTITVVVTLVNKDTQNNFKFDDNTKTVTYGDADFTVKADSAVKDSTVTYSSDNMNVATVDNNGNVHIVGVGSATITATASETADYSAATATYTLTVNKKEITAPTADSTQFTYNGKEQTYKLAENDAYTITGNKQTNANENGYTVTVALKDKANTKWAGEGDGTADKTYKFVINKATVTITAKDQTAYVGGSAPTLGEDSYTVSGLCGEDKLTTSPTIQYVDAAGKEITPDMTKTGETNISVSGAAASENYTISYISGKLTVSAAPSGGSSIQKPTIIADTGAGSKLSYNGRTLTITAEEGYEITDVLVNGVSKGKVTEVTNLRTGDKVEVKTAKKAEPTDPAADKNAKLIKGIKNTSIILKSKRTKDGKVLLTWTKSKGYKVDYFEVYRSVKKNSGYGKKPFFTTKDGSWSKYLNTKNLKAGKTYYYKVRGVRVIDGKKYCTEYSNKTWRTVK